MGTTYITIVTVASFGFFFAAVIEKMLQATGNMVMPMIIQLVGAVANIIFDPILIFNFNMGVAGAAYATVGGQILSMWAFAFCFSATTRLRWNLKASVSTARR